MRSRGGGHQAYSIRQIVFTHRRHGQGQRGTGLQRAPCRRPLQVPLERHNPRRDEHHTTRSTHLGQDGGRVERAAHDAGRQADQARGATQRLARADPAAAGRPAGRV